MSNKDKYFYQNPGGTYSFICPGCGMHHTVNGKWNLSWKDGKPTLSPSILDQWKSTKTEGQEICHVFVRNGKIQFLPDSTNELAGKTVDIILYD